MGIPQLIAACGWMQDPMSCHSSTPGCVRNVHVVAQQHPAGVYGT